MTDETAQQRRYKSFEDTHQMLIEQAVGLIADRGIDALSLSALAAPRGSTAPLSIIISPIVTPWSRR
ncbi:hypothetical protein ACFSUK_29450 [Sphingobium scionense]